MLQAVRHTDRHKWRMLGNVEFIDSLDLVCLAVCGIYKKAAQEKIQLQFRLKVYILMMTDLY